MFFILQHDEMICCMGEKARTQRKIEEKIENSILVAERCNVVDDESGMSHACSEDPGIVRLRLQLESSWNSLAGWRYSRDCSRQPLPPPERWENHIEFPLWQATVVKSVSSIQELYRLRYLLSCAKKIDRVKKREKWAATDTHYRCTARQRRDTSSS